MKKYLLLEERDKKILEKCKHLEKSKLTKEDKHTIELIKTQLERDWRKPLLKALNKLERKYE